MTFNPPTPFPGPVRPADEVGFDCEILSGSHHKVDPFGVRVQERTLWGLVGGGDPGRPRDLDQRRLNLRGGAIKAMRTPKTTTALAATKA